MIVLRRSVSRRRCYGFRIKVSHWEHSNWSGHVVVAFTNNASWV